MARTNSMNISTKSTKKLERGRINYIFVLCAAAKMREVDNSLGLLIDETWLLFVQLWKFLAKLRKLRHIVINDVRLVRMICQIVLVIAFGRMERVER